MVMAARDDRTAGAAAYLRAFALVLGGHYLAKAAAADASRTALAVFQAAHLLPEAGGLCAAATAGSALLYADGLV